MYVNQRALRAALEEADIPSENVEIENSYRLLTDDASNGTCMRT